VIVYGDPSRFERVDGCRENLRLRMEAIVRDGCGAGEALEECLERAGELEQAVFDAPEAMGPDPRAGLRARAASRRLASCLADAVIRREQGDLDGCRSSLRRAGHALNRLEPSGATLRFQVPEGFAFYALSPKAYREQASVWAREHRRDAEDGAVVIGIRSIGAALSAGVASALRARGIPAKRITVRPSGHPFHRVVRGPIPRAPRARFGIVVDEGPGLSGSSMLAAAEALARSGVGEIALVPAHGGGPGPRASDATRARWDSMPVYAADRGGASLRSQVAEVFRTIFQGADPEDIGTVDLGAGAWRRVPYLRERTWPAVARPLERPKLLATAPDGARAFVKFCGTAAAPGTSLGPSLAAQTAARSVRLARAGFAPRVLGESGGFVAWEWIEGTPLDHRDASFPFLARLGAYLASASLPPLSRDAAQAARDRTEEMLRANAFECLGAEAARAARSGMTRHPVPIGAPQAGDGRLAPHEWIRPRWGSVFKTDVGGHDVDHTWTGPQPVHWDLAGALEEWDLHGARAEAMLRAYRQAGGISIAPAALDGYRAAYAAHRAGQAAFFRDIEPDPDERDRLGRAFERWRGRLAQALLSDGVGATVGTALRAAR